MGCSQPIHQKSVQEKSFKDNPKTLSFRNVGVPRADGLYNQCQEISDMISKYSRSLGKLRKDLFNELDLYNIQIKPDTQLAIEVLVLGLQIRGDHYSIDQESADVNSSTDWGAYRAFKFYNTEIKLANDYTNQHFLKIQDLIIEGNALSSNISKIIDEMGFDVYEKLSIIQNISCNGKLLIKMRSEFFSFKMRVTKALRNMQKGTGEVVKYKNKIEKITPEHEATLPEIYALYMRSRDLN